MMERYRPDIALDSNSLVLALINHDNNTNLTSKDIVLHSVEVNDSEDIIPKNTQAFVAKARKPNGKKIIIYYDRLDTDHVMSNFQPLLISLDGTETGSHHTLAAINEYCGTSLTMEDIVSASITLDDETHELIMSEDCPAWLGSFMTTLFTPTQSVLGTDDGDVLLIGDDGVLTIDEVEHGVAR